jgi:circadian clock protein KaiC
MASTKDLHGWTPGRPLPKTPTGIRGLDAITDGGLPLGRPTLVCGGAGCGKTLLAMEFIVRGAVDFGEPGVFLSFEETAADLIANVASLGFDLPSVIADGKMVLDHVHLERSEIEETGEYDLEGLFVRLGHAIDSVGAKRVVLDSIEALFSGLQNAVILRAELRRLFRWLKARGMTAVVTGERGDTTLTRFGIEEYVSDCVIVLDHRVSDQVSTRRLRVAKYRGSLHGANEYPFLIDLQGISVLPVTSVGLDHSASVERVPTGVARLDTMLGGEGFFRGSSILVSGTAGSGKTSIAAHFADATCRRGERCLTFLFEEAPSQLLRNMRSIGLDLQPWVEQGLLRFHAARPSFSGLETHLAVMLAEIEGFEPGVVIVDPMSSFAGLGSLFEVKAMWLRLVDYLKGRGVTLLLISLTATGGALEHTEVEISSLIDTWLLLRDMEANGERNRGLYVLKSRGMAHSNQIREFLLTDHGVELTDVYLGAGGMLTGSARRAREDAEAAEKVALAKDMQQRSTVLERRRRALESQIEAMRAEFATEESEIEALLARDEHRAADVASGRVTMSDSRQADADSTAPAGWGGPHTEAQS